MGRVEDHILEGSQILSRLLAAPEVSCNGLTPNQLRDEPGLYLVFEKGAGSGKFLRAGRNDEGGLRQRLYKNHLMGDRSGNLRAQLVRDGRCRTLNASTYPLCVQADVDKPLPYHIMSDRARSRQG